MGRNNRVHLTLEGEPDTTGTYSWKLTWAPVANANQQIIYTRALNGAWTKLTTLGGAVNEYPFNSPPTADTRYKVVAYLRSDTLTIPQNLPTAPTASNKAGHNINMLVLAGGQPILTGLEDEIDLTWTPGSGGNTQLVQRRVKGIGSFVTVDTVTEVTKTYDDDPLAPGFYDYRIGNSDGTTTVYSQPATGSTNPSLESDIDANGTTD